MSKTLTATVVEINPEAFAAAGWPADELSPVIARELEQCRVDEERYQRFMSKLAKCMAELDALPL